ncbi:PREDICTED: putative F-box/kelch-repeat protein At3g17540 [Camelina sativa]|uniref:F-box/kelch-repeat protein At3g17540 n=1 Tax=Camelina sativa TaxID=90675 RepID=A0ABM0W500_CAMSA|nr:PREDICTED: putative F-box/kelch-repeat protein At3g17540 [Camelina sativa]
MMMITDLPHDLESEILSRVPAKSLAKLKTTCKRWYALFRDPNFVKTNLDKEAARELILLMNRRVHSISVNLSGIRNSVDPSMEVSGKLSSKDLKISNISHCDGLLLCTTNENTRLVVWNPCTGQTRSIKPRTRYRRNGSYTVGYVNSKSSCHSRNYKMLRICRYYDHQKLRAADFEIYDFGSDSWKVIDDGITWAWGTSSPGVSLNGNTYWVGRESETDIFLMSFDFTAERFVRLPLPYQIFDYDDIAILSSVREEKLSLLKQNFHVLSTEVKIWVTNKFAEAKDLLWSQFLVIDFSKFMLPSRMSVLSFLLDEENKVAVCCDTDMEDGYKTSVYIVGVDLYKEVYKDVTKELIFNCPRLVSYVPSLVNIQRTHPKAKRKRD